MRFIKVGVACLNQTPLDWQGNLNNIKAVLAQAKKEEVQILCLPELALTGYGCEDGFFSRGIQQYASQLLLSILPETENIITNIGLPIFKDGRLYNGAALISNKRILGFYLKRTLPGDGVHYEPRWFRAWPENIISSYSLEGVDYPIGDIFFEIDGIKIGFEICEDAWSAERPGIKLAKAGVDIIFNPSASHFAFDKQKTRDRFILEGSRAFSSTYLYSNLLGNEAGRIIYDGGGVIASSGKIISRGERLSFKDNTLTTANIDIDIARMERSKLFSFENIDPDLNEKLINDKYPIKSSSSLISHKTKTTWEDSDYLKEEEFLRATTLALFDYLRKSKSKGFLISLSGGADSSASTVLISNMVHLAIKDLGIDQFKYKLRHIDSIQNLNTPEEIVKHLLTCVYQETDNSSEITKTAASKIATGCGATFYHYKIDHIIEQYKLLIQSSLGIELNWKEHDLALQNIQARVRSPGIWMIANIKNFLLLSTSNRSEAAVGYTTMDGDTSGGLNPIGGIDKAFLRKWLKWSEKIGSVDLTPLPFLSYVNSQEPTAELRPADQNQTDEKDLMPYEVLDEIERLAIRDKLLPKEIYFILKDRGEPFNRLKIKDWIIKFFNLWSINQWKRERYAPSFHLDDENLDPKTWCRFPILSGSYQDEISELKNIQ